VVKKEKTMNNQGKKTQPRRSFRESDDFRNFKEMLSGGFVAEGTILPRPELLTFSEKLARLLRKSDRRDSDTVNHFRTFFHQVTGFKQLEDTTQIEVELRMMRAKMLYAAGRQTISRDVSLVIQECIDTLLTCENIMTQLPGFCGFFESLYAYYYYQAQRNSRRRRG
jgi:CRISPR type III-A-associated protein Csm2